MLIHARAVQQHPLAQSRGSFQQQMRRLRKYISSFQGKVDKLMRCAKQASKVRTFSLDLAASDSNDDCFSQQLSITSSLHDCNDNLRDAFQCISVHRAA